MGRKGVSKRKPKKSGPSSNQNKGRSGAGDGSAVQNLVKDKGAPLNRGGTNPATGSNRSPKKR